MREKIKSNWLAILATIVSTGLVGEILGVWNLSIERQDSYITRYVECNELIADLQHQILVLEFKIEQINCDH